MKRKKQTHGSQDLKNVSQQIDMNTYNVDVSD